MRGWLGTCSFQPIAEQKGVGTNPSSTNPHGAAVQLVPAVAPPYLNNGVGYVLVHIASGGASLVERLLFLFIALCPLLLGAGIGGMLPRNTSQKKTPTAPRMVLLALIILYAVVCIVGVLIGIPEIAAFLVSLLFNAVAYLVITLLCVFVCIAVRRV